ncbi:MULTISPECIES: hypothetical protein [Streptomyces]|uniref:hypothetical protein n=1 Tax=Streptomyces TaxID=1883 RepID=UPI0029B199E4|nr:hypothetical protein [Streptomyces scabiei]MDX3117894.1 hypothetical protein [Streptomyces scabiei]
MTGARDERRPAGELEAAVMATLWAAGAPLTPGRVQSELDRDTDRETVLARFVAQLGSGDEQHLRRLLEGDER